MEEQPSKRRGRPRKVVVRTDDGAEVQGATDQHDGNGQAGGDGHPAQANPAGQAEAGDWLTFVAKVDAFVCTRGTDYVAAAIHPAPLAAVIESQYPVAVEVGPVGIRNKHGQLMAV